MDRKGDFILLRRFGQVAIKHVQSNMIIYFLVCMFFIIGISSGAFTIRALGEYQKQELINYIQNSFQILNHQPVKEVSVFKQSILNNLQTGAFIWILGITVIGIPIILILIAIRGFIIGFTVGFFIDQLGIKGMLFSLISVLPQNIFIIPGILVVAVIGISFSKMIIRNKINKSYNTHNIFKQFILYSTIISFIFLIILLGCMVEAYIIPIFIRMFYKYI